MLYLRFVDMRFFSASEFIRKLAEAGGARPAHSRQMGLRKSYERKVRNLMRFRALA